MSKKKPGLTPAPMPLPGVGVPAPYNVLVKNLDADAVAAVGRPLLMRMVESRGTIETPEATIKRVVLKSGMKLRIVKATSKDVEITPDVLSRLEKALFNPDDPHETVVISVPFNVTIEVFEER